MKLLVVLVALLLLVWLLFGSTRRRARRDQDPSPGSRAARRAPPPVEGMVACAHCGVHLPASAALLAHGKTYCSVSHRDSGPSAP